MKFVDSVMSPGITPSWTARKVIDKLKKEVKDERETKEDK
jgi:hypothetical protein